MTTVRYLLAFAWWAFCLTRVLVGGSQVDDILVRTVPGSEADGLSGPRAGKRGYPGEIGKPGPDGVDGIPGLRGSKGPPGPPGVNGEKGYHGTPGEWGIEGGTGPKGEIGSPGRVPTSCSSRPFLHEATVLYCVRGDKGPKGMPGMPGWNGPLGHDGDPGALGPQGPRGRSGRFGRPGYPGGTGIKPSISLECDRRHTSWWRYTAFFPNNKFLLGLNVACSGDEFMQRVGVEGSASGSQIRYTYTCCNVTASFDDYFDR